MSKRKPSKIMSEITLPTPDPQQDKPQKQFSPRTFSDDTTGRQAFGEQLLDHILADSPLTEEGYTLTINAPYGSGKSKFIKHWVDDIKQRNIILNHITKEHNILTIDTWEGDFLGSPILQITNTILNDLKLKNHTTSKPIVNSLIKSVQFIASTGLSAGHQFIEGKSGINIKKTIDDGIEGNLTPKSDAHEEFCNHIELYKLQLKNIDTLRKQLTKLTNKGKSSLIIILDELDRCKPTYAIEYLETIKHLFNVDGIIFVIAADLTALKSTAKVMFGADLNFTEYYRKFSQRVINLPNPNEMQIGDLHRELRTKYISDLNRDLISPNLDYHQVQDWTIEILEGNITPTFRQLHEYYRCLSCLFALLIKKLKTNEADRVMAVTATYLTTLFIWDRNTFTKIKKCYNTKSFSGELLQSGKGITLKSTNSENIALAWAFIMFVRTPINTSIQQPRDENGNHFVNATYFEQNINSLREFWIPSKSTYIIEFILNNLEFIPTEDK